MWPIGEYQCELEEKKNKKPLLLLTGVFCVSQNAVQIMQSHTELIYPLLTGMLMSLTIIINFSFQLYHFFPPVF